MNLNRKNSSKRHHKPDLALDDLRRIISKLKPLGIRKSEKNKPKLEKPKFLYEEKKPKPKPQIEDDEIIIEFDDPE